MEHKKSKWWLSLKDFLLEQHDIEKLAVMRMKGVWERDDESRFKKFAVQLSTLQAQSKEGGKPLSLRSTKKIYRSPVDGAYWHMNLFVWPDGRVEMYHSKIAERKIMQTTQRERNDYGQE